MTKPPRLAKMALGLQLSITTRSRFNSLASQWHTLTTPQFASAVESAVAVAVEATTAALLKRLYGPKNEMFDSRQLLLFGERIDQLPPTASRPLRPTCFAWAVSRRR